MSANYNARIVTDGLVLCLDPANTKSYGPTTVEALVVAGGGAGGGGTGGGGGGDDGRGGIWGQLCLKNGTSTAIGTGGLSDFPHYATYSVAGQDDCSRSDQTYTATKCSNTRRFAIYVK